MKMKYNNKFEKAHVLVPKWPSALGKKHLKTCSATPRSRELSLWLASSKLCFRHLSHMYYSIAESTVHGLHGPPPTGQSLFTSRVAGDQEELN